MTMKRWLCFLLIAVLSLGMLSGCKGAEEEDFGVADSIVEGDESTDPKDDKDPEDEKDDPKDEDPKEEDPKDEDPKEDEPKEENPKDEDPKDEDPKEEDPKEETPADPNEGEEDLPPITKENSGVAITILTQNLRTSGTQRGEKAERGSGDHNLWHRFRRLKSQVREWEPDVIMTQEGMSGHVNLLTTDPYFDQVYDIVWKNRGPNNDDSIVDDQSVPVLYKTSRFTLVDSGHFWLSETPHIPSIGYGATEEYARITTWVRLKDKATGVELYAYSAHFAVTETFHIRAMEQFMNAFDKLKKGTYAFVAGDFNIRYKSFEYDSMLEWDRIIDLKDMALNMQADGLAQVEGDTGTVHSRYDKNGKVQDEWAEGEPDVEPFGDLRQIDHIFAKPDPHMAVDYWSVIYKQYGYDEGEEFVKNGYLSDHYGVVCKVRVDTQVDYSRYQHQNPDSPAL